MQPETIKFLEVIGLRAIAAFQIGITLYLIYQIGNYKNILSGGFLVIQRYLSKTSLRNFSSGINQEENIIKALKEISDEETEEDVIPLSLVQLRGGQKGKTLENYINTYLVNNYGAAVNFSIIKDLIDREVETHEEEITQAIPVPLYLGLAATMAGIIAGLFSMPEIDNKGENFNTAINALIDGVKMAMGVSLLGLACTTLISAWFFKRAKSKSLRDKNKSISYLQAHLLPELIRAEDTGVSGLKQSLDHFARKATSIVDKVSEVAENTTQNLQYQQQVIEKVEQLKMTRISKANLELFDKLDANMARYDKFSESMDHMARIALNLKKFAQHSNNMDAIAEEVRQNLHRSTELSEFLTHHLKEIKTFGNHSKEAVDMADLHFQKSIKQLTEATSARIDAMNNTSSLHEIKLKEIYQDIGIKLNQITSEHLDAFSLAYNEAVPNFKKLDNLDKLQPIHESIEASPDKLKEHANNQFTELKQEFDQVKQALLNVKRGIQDVDGSIKNIKLTPNPKTSVNGQPKKPEHKKEKKKKGFLGRLFGRKKKTVV